ncbi:MAG: DHH family phosphoesterase [Clostridia bacterium]|nr:DHH family phosphoesterase [Clostridia bacterium]
MKDLLGQLKSVLKQKHVIAAISAILLLTFIGGIIKPLIFPAGIIILLIYISATVVFFRKTNGPGSAWNENNAIVGITLDFVTKFRTPVVILDSDTNIIWYNSAFISKSESRHSLYGKNASETISPALTPARLEQLKSGATFSVTYNNVEYTVSGYALVSGGKHFCIVVLDDKSELVAAQKKLAESNSVVAFIMLDNIGESLEFAQDKYRSVSASVAGIISEWARSVCGMVKEYERDKYIIIFEQKYLDAVLTSKFDILDSIRATEIEGASVPVTASIGMSNIPGSLAEKETAARGALEQALQRGGDQAVLRTENSTEYYGGKTKTVQKKTKIRSRIVAGELVNLINQSGNVIIMGHKFCDHDSIASCVAAARIATHLQKTVKIVINLHDANLKPIFQRMRGMNYYYELFTDAASAQDMIRSDTLLIICDTNNPDLFESREIYENCVNYAIIDHHRKVQEDYLIPPKLAYIEPSASSASELISEIAEYAIPQGSLTKIEAELLFAGIILDTNNFKKNTGTKTFSAALYLRGQGADPNDAQKFFRTSLDDFLYESNIENNISVYRDSIIIASCALPSENASQTKLVSSKSADRLLNIAGVSASFVLAEIGDDINISARSDGTINVQLIAEALGGGGHFDSAGALMHDITLQEASDMLKDAIDTLLDNTKQ